MIVESPLIRLEGSRGPYPYHDRKHLQVAVSLQDFFFGDETGTQGDANYLVLAGYIGSPRQWALFDAEWRKVLVEHRVPAFHASKFFQQASWQSRSSPYHGWSTEEGVAFLTELLQIIDWRNIVPIGCAVDIASFEAQDLALRKYVTGSTLLSEGTEKKFRSWIAGTGAPDRPPYQAALRSLLVEALFTSRPNARVEFVFDENNDEEPLTRKLFRDIHQGSWAPPELKERVGGVRFENDAAFPGLQAADLWCYLWNLNMRGRPATTFHLLAHEYLLAKRNGIALLGPNEFARLERVNVKKINDRLAQWRGEQPS